MEESAAKISQESYAGYCFVCGQPGAFERRHASLREGFQCGHCRASLRYRGQAEALLEVLDSGAATSLRALNEQGQLAGLSIYEPGVTGPFRQLITSAETYVRSFYWDDVTPGTRRDGILCQDLEALTFADERFDLVISSDIMEHVRHPMRAFAEINRVLRPGGVHLFSIPVQTPMLAESRKRVDTSGEEDVHIEPPHYHGDGRGGRSLVYTDFGLRLAEALSSQGAAVTLHRPSDPHPEAQRLVTFSVRKKRTTQADALSACCNICGSTEFREGPLGRRALNGKLPACNRCGSLERHRAMHAAWQAVPKQFLENKHALQFSRDPTVDRRWFKDLEISVYGTASSLDIQALDREDDRYDVVICNHVLEHVEQDQAAFKELLRVLKPEGFLQMSVPSPASKAVTEDWGYAKASFHGHFRHYGMDLLERFSPLVPGVGHLVVPVKDPVTGLKDVLFFWSRSAATIDQLEAWLSPTLPVSR